MPLTEMNIRFHTMQMEKKTKIEDHAEKFQAYYNNFVNRHSDYIYSYLLKIAANKYNADPTIAKMQKGLYDRFMRLNTEIYNDNTDMRKQYPMFNESKYNHTVAIRQISQKAYNRRIAATLSY